MSVMRDIPGEFPEVVGKLVLQEKKKKKETLSQTRWKEGTQY